MIRFACKCGNQFNVADDRAGEMLQCPRCSLLVDVPRADELAWLGPDGTYAIDTTGDDAPRPGETLAEMYRIHSRKTTDEFGNYKDLRPTAEFYRNIGDEPLEGHTPRRIAPRYDPETGERILPLGLKDEPPQPVLSLAVEVHPDELDELPVEAIPVAGVVAAAPEIRPGVRARSLGYATGETTGHTASLRSLPVDLLARPGNATVLFFVFWFYVAAELMMAAEHALSFGGIAVPGLVVVLSNVPLWLLLAHYGCVVQDVGPEAIDELPRPLRNFSPGEDVFGPGLRVAAAILLCYGPMLVVGGVTGLQPRAAAAATLLLGAMGSYLFPAVTLTLLTAGTVLNLSPGRLVGVIVQCGPQYALSALLAAASVVLALAVVLGPSVVPALEPATFLHAFGRPVVMVPALCVVMYVTHFFAWHLGLMYRAHHDGFPWVAQRHIRTPRPERRPAYLER